MKYSVHNDAIAYTVIIDKSFSALNPELQKYFLNGIYTIAPKQTSRPMDGSYLVIAEPLTGMKQCESEARNRVGDCAAFISLLHGGSVATECHFLGIYDLKHPVVSVISPPTFVSHTDKIDSLDREIAKILDGYPDLDITTTQII